jgi:dethiobiotin synthetase
MRGIFITGTDTDVGKTFVTSAIAAELHSAGRRVGIYKPVCSGAEETADGSFRWRDVETHVAALGNAFPREWICPQCFRAPAAPPVAARLEGAVIDRGLISAGLRHWSSHVELLLIEGVGGFLCPLTDSETVADFAVEAGCPVLLVSASKLGVINQTLLTLEAIRNRKLPIAGIILNHVRPPEDGFLDESNLTELAARCDAPILSRVAYRHSGRLQPLSEGSTMDWFALAGELATPPA